MKNILVSSIGGLAKALSLLCTLLMVGSIVAMAISVFIQIILRGGFNTTWLPLDDLVVYGFAIIVFSGTALVFQTNTHLATPILGSASHHVPKRFWIRCKMRCAFFFLDLCCTKGFFIRLTECHNSAHCCGCQLG